MATVRSVRRLWSVTVPTPSSTKELGHLTEVLALAMFSIRWDNNQLAEDIRTATMEALSNAVKHGNRYDPTKDVTLAIGMNHKEVRVSVMNQGPTFTPNPNAIRKGPASLMLDWMISKNSESGRGIPMMTILSDSIEYKNRGREVHMVFSMLRGKSD